MGIFDFLPKKEFDILGVKFPIFIDGNKRWVTSKRTPKYQRKDYYYKYEPEKISAYTPLINQYGFKRVNDKKYIKENSYIIIEKYNNFLHIVFHVNK